MDSKAIGKKLIELRGNLSRIEVATAVGVSLSAVMMYETGQRVPRDEIKSKFADYYKKTVQEIFFN